MRWPIITLFITRTACRCPKTKKGKTFIFPFLYPLDVLFSNELLTDLARIWALRYIIEDPEIVECKHFIRMAWLNISITLFLVLFFTLRAGIYRVLLNLLGNPQCDILRQWCEIARQNAMLSLLNALYMSRLKCKHNITIRKCQVNSKLSARHYRLYFVTKVILWHSLALW